tara:strand:+ start:8693 stop:9151 length:459 start_codon:yes stop_codon:yes gene_type:complete
MQKKNKKYKDIVVNIFSEFENYITIGLSVVIGFMIIMSFIRVSQQFYHLFYADFIDSKVIVFNDYQVLFGRIMTLLISLEFLASILKVLKTHEIKILVQDVILITAMAIARKLIIYDYERHEPMQTLVLGAILLSLGLFYFLIRSETKKPID